MKILKTISEKYEFERLGTNWNTEIIAGLSLFMSLSYIFIVNPAILSQTGMPSGAVFFATVIASAVATLAMGLYAKLPFALATGFESNGFFTFVVVATLGFTWQEALGLVFWSGVLCLFFTIIPLRQKIIDSIPEGLKTAISTSVGVFVAVIGLVVTDIVTFSDGLPTGVGDIFSPKALLLVVGFALALILSSKKFKISANMIIAIICCTILAHFVGVESDTPPANTNEFLSALGQLDLFVIFTDPRAWSALLVFFMIDYFGSIGKFIGLTRETTLQSNGKVSNMKKALNVDGGGTILGSLLGTSTVITFVESAVAIGQGGRTGIVAIVCAICMFLSLTFAGLVALVPVAAVSGVLIYVGWLLLPRQELSQFIKKDAKENMLDNYDLIVIAIMGLLTAFTFSLDKALLLGFAFYAVKGVIKNKRADIYLFLSTFALAIAMAFQYFGLK